MPVTLFAGLNTALSIGTEHQFDVNEAGVYIYEMDLSLLAAGDILKLQVYGVTLTGGAVSPIGDPIFFSGAQPAWAVAFHSEAYSNNLTDSASLRFGLTQIAGTGRAIPRKVLKHA